MSFLAKESQNVEYKLQWRDDYIRWICGFANANGGKIYIGVDDNGLVKGVNNASKLMEDIPNKVRDLIGVVVDVNLYEDDGKQYLEIVTEPYSHPISYKGEYHYRSGSTKQELRGAALDQFILKKNGKTWDSVPVNDLTVEELDIPSINLFKNSAVRSQRISQDILVCDTAELLSKLHLFDGNKLKRAAVLSFYSDPERFVTGAFVKIGYFTSDDNLLFQDEIHGSLFKQVHTAIDLLSTKYLKSAITYDGLQRVDELPLPLSALREGLMNAVVHKNYGGHIPIQISVYPTKLMIWNPAVLPQRWTIESLLTKHASVPYNSELANVFFRAGEIEAWGRGIERIFSDCKQYGNKSPEWKFDGTGLWTVFHIKTDHKTNHKTDHKETMRLSIAQREILNLLASNPSLTQKELVKEVGISLSGIKYNLSQLVKYGLLTRMGGKKSGHWVVTDRQN
ncbi:MAG: putative DNA binding domain-containing protein [Muribaculaceae bacterium]|nr:putative DNA binding domain-containing protein [Muribaculaceae bacterium]